MEYCTEDRGGNITVHVIEGNNPSTVARNTYELNSSSILGYGTVREVADTTMVFGNQGEKVRQLQERLAYLGFLRSDLVTGKFTDSTTEAIRAYQEARGLRIIGVANRETQQLLEKEYNEAYQSDPDIWSVVDED